MARCGLAGRRTVILGADGRPIGEKNGQAKILGLDGKPISKEDKGFTLAEEKTVGKRVTGLEGILKDMIKTTGPISIANFMKQCLVNPEYEIGRAHV